MKKPISMADVASAAGVSKNTVSLALRGDAQIPQATCDRIVSIAKRLGYTRNPVVGELMARLHAGGARRFRSTLALINANEDEKAFERHPTIPMYVEGCNARAKELGYRFDRFWLHESGMSAARWIQMLKARGIGGGVLVGLMRGNQLPSTFRLVLNELPFVVTGVRTRDPELSFACVDHHLVAVRAFEKVLELGWRRPGLVLDPEIDTLVEHRFSAGYRTSQQRIPANRRLKPFYAITKARQDIGCFKDWLKREKPDVVFGLYNELREWIESCGFKVPNQIAVVQYEWRPQQPEWPGMHQHNDLVGQAAVDMLVGMLHRGEKGVPEFQRSTLISPSWMNGI